MDITGARAIIVLKIQKIQTSCGFSLPQFNKELEADGEDAVVMVNHHDGNDAEEANQPSDETLDDWARKRVERRNREWQARLKHLRNLGDHSR